MDFVLVSVIIPTYSRPSNLVRAVDSVLAQTYKNVEIIVVDDNGVGSKCQIETQALLREYIDDKKVIYKVHEKNRNGSAARNTGVRASQGEYVCFLDDDDVFLPEKIKMQINCLKRVSARNQQTQGCYCNIRQIGYNRTVDIICLGSNNLVEDILLSKLVFNSSTIMVSRKSFDAIGGFDERYWRHQDLEFYMRYLQKFNMVCADPDDVLVTKYQTPNIVSSNPLKSIDYLEFFIANFRHTLDELPKRKQVYSHLYAKLASHLVRGHYRVKGILFFLKATSYRLPSFEDHLHFYYSFIVSNR